MSLTIFFNDDIRITDAFGVAGPKESLGPLSKFYDIKLQDDKVNEKSFEKAESKIVTIAINGLFNKNKLNDNDIDLMIFGDLQNQITASNFAVRNYMCSYLGVYNACASFVESLIIGSSFLNNNF